MKLIGLLLIIVAITTVNANQDDVPQCVYDLLYKAKTNQICKQSDTDCLRDLKSLDNCSLNCKGQNQNKQPQTFNCVKNNCKPTNPYVQVFFDELIKCESTIYSSIVLFSTLFAFIFLLI
ncbi:transmembrane protein, putative (macronuclear) [Tetrahymena thermophila SB210]|uniref:Transmembrane protein, putative n=1 Tax=Tetrahymena thermophila (strain SB210) TaxID=312017 RepID=Q23HA5_TETTS|nr:transmembrane protein, putative [Tetrahymena thermophila SB210]EAR95903.1 transmembrane protein, putative [Tetrahymena thermophila SB210]|eukprot:XP_001016148.1 transmembrane protein, putative [Tetrahymena thermophila SB210]